MANHANTIFNLLQGNFAPIHEIGEAMILTSIEGEIPKDFPEGVYIRNGVFPKYIYIYIYIFKLRNTQKIQLVHFLKSTLPVFTNKINK